MIHKTLDRRDFIRLGGLSLAATFPVFLRKTAAALPAEPALSHKSLVVLQLSGAGSAPTTLPNGTDPSAFMAEYLSKSSSQPAAACAAGMPRELSIKSSIAFVSAADPPSSLGSALRAAATCRRAASAPFSS